MNVSVLERTYKELRSEYHCLNETIEELENSGETEVSNELKTFYTLTKERIEEIREQMRFIEGMVFGLSLEDKNKFSIYDQLTKEQ